MIPGNIDTKGQFNDKKSLHLKGPLAELLNHSGDWEVGQ